MYFPTWQRRCAQSAGRHRREKPESAALAVDRAAADRRLARKGQHRLVLTLGPELVSRTIGVLRAGSGEHEEKRMPWHRRNTVQRLMPWKNSI